MTGNESSIATHVTAEAAQWFTVMQDRTVSVGERARFAEWLGRSADHVSEYLAVAAVRHDLRRTRLSSEALGQLIDEARKDVGSDNVVPLAERAVVLKSPERFGECPRRSWAMLALAAGIASALVATAWFGADLWLHGARYTTGIGEQTTFPLADGSVLRLNTQSAVRVRLMARERRIELLRGEVLFEVAKDSARPFRVHAGTTRVEAVGTTFNVYRHEHESTVTVLEGKVLVEAPQITPTPLLPREQARISPKQGITKTRQIDPARVVAWKDRRLAFSGETLRHIVDEFNRYNEAPLRIADPELVGMQITAVFSSTDAQSLIDFLRRIEHVEAYRGPDGALELRRAADR